MSALPLEAATVPPVARRPDSPAGRLRLVAYLRVSTDRQADRGLGLEVQEQAIREWARRERVRLVDVVRDEGKSGGADVLDRPGLATALGYVRAGRADGIVVARLDRLARDLVLQEWLRAELVRDQAQLRSTDPTEDLHLAEAPGNPTGKLVRRILGAIAEYEREMIALRMHAGKAAKLERGGYAHGRPPYGWQAVAGELVRDAQEQGTIARMRRLRRAGKSLREIAAQLEAEGKRTRAGKRWSPQAIARILAR